MPFRQVTLFRIGCWMAVLTAVAHLTGHVMGPADPANETERTLLDLATTYQLTLPDGAERSLMDLMNGMSLSFTLLLTLVGAVGLLVARRCQHDGPMMSAVARTLAIGGAVLLVISLTYWFLVPSMLISMMALAFALAAVKPPEEEPGT